MRECVVCRTDISHKKKRTVHCSMSCANKTIQKRRHPNFNEDFFSVPNLENCYWAGFIAADGCIRERPNRSKILQIGLSSVDRSHLEAFIESVGKGSIYDYTHKATRSGPSYSAVSIQIGSDKLCNDLGSVFNIFPRKTFTLKPPNLEGEMAHAFIAGYIDGDGCYHKNTNRPALQALGTYEILEWILNIYGLGDKKISAKGNVWQFWISGKDALALRESFHRLNLPLLKRKVDRWEQLGANLNYD